MVQSADKEGQCLCGPLFAITSSGEGRGDPAFCSVEAPLWLWHQQSTEKITLKYTLWESTRTSSPQPGCLTCWAHRAITSPWLWTTPNRRGQRVEGAAGQCHCAGPSGQWTGTSCLEKKECKLQREATEIQATDFLRSFVRLFWMHYCCHSFFC